MTTTSKSNSWLNNLKTSLSVWEKKNTEKYITFSVPIKQETENGQTITYKKKFSDSVRFMSSSLSSLVDNLSQKFHEGKYKDCMSDLEYAAT